MSHGTVVVMDPLNLDDYERLATESLSHMALEYLSAGIADDITLKANREAFAKLRIAPRMLVDVSRIDTRCQLFGRTHEFPILLAPAAYHRLFHERGELETIEGANLAEATLVSATFATHTIEDVAALATQPFWFQLYVNPDRGFTRDLLERAMAAGAEAICIALDVPTNGPRERELRAGFALPEGVDRANLRALGNAVAAAAHRPSGRNIYAAVRAPNVTWKDIEWMQSFVNIPIVLKGILRPDDAVRAADCGASGVVVSNHGGRSLDTVPPSIEALPRIADAVGGRIPLLLDGGIRRGTDVYKALALGARAVLIGRPYLFALAVHGAPGIARVVNMLRTELEMTMGLSGVTSLAEITPDMIWR